MSDQRQCECCKKRCYDCGYYDNNSSSFCDHFEAPVNNSRMFSHWYAATGRIGRLEYILTLLLALMLVGIMYLIANTYIEANDILLYTSWDYRIYTGVVFGPSIILLVLAGIKRAHDAGSPDWLAYAPVAYIIWPNIFLLIFGILGTLYLVKDPSEEGVNEYGTNPSDVYTYNTKNQIN